MGDCVTLKDVFSCGLRCLYVGCSSIKTLPSSEYYAAVEMVPSAGCSMRWVRFSSFLLMHT